jgi:hypothetical protein
VKISTAEKIVGTNYEIESLKKQAKRKKQILDFAKCKLKFLN